MSFGIHGEIEEAIRDIARRGLQCSIELATVIAPFVPVNPIPGAVGAAPLVEIAFQPGNRHGEARVAFLGAGPLQGVLTPLAVGTEVLVLHPLDEPANCVILGAFHSTRSPLPPTWTGLNARAQFPTGLELRSAEGLPADGIVLGAFLLQFQTFLLALDTYMAAIKAIADPTNAATSAFGTATAAFHVALATSAVFVDPDSGGVGGPPFASALFRSTT